MRVIQFEPVSEDNMHVFVRMTRETLWQPVYPGDDAVVREWARWPLPIRKDTLLISADGEPVGRVVAPQFDDYHVIRDLGLRADHDVMMLTAQALLERAARQRARVVRAILHEPFWRAFRAIGLEEQKRRVSMQCELDPPAPAPAAESLARTLESPDTDEVGVLMHSAYAGSVDDGGESVEQWIDHARDVMGGQYGTFLDCCSFVTPIAAPFASGVLAIENARQSALIAQVVTRREQANRGLARRLLGYSLAALAAHGYRRCFLEVTLTNLNAMHLYHSLGFVSVGPRIVYAVRLLAHVP